MTSKKRSSSPPIAPEAKKQFLKAKKKDFRQTKVVPPTSEEIINLREAQDLFKSNLFRLQLNEMLSEIKLDYLRLGKLDSALHKLNSFMSELPTEQNLSLLPKYTTNLPVKLQNLLESINFTFAPPENINVIGSFLLHTITKPILNVDIAVEIPKSVFNPKLDLLNYRYFDKRNLYLNVLYTHLKESQDFKAVEIEYFRGDHRKPILSIPLTEAKLFFLRIFPTFSDSTFEPKALKQTKRNIEKENDVKKISNYNNRIMEDMHFADNLKYLHGVVDTCSSLGEAIMIFKAWLYKRRIIQSTDSFNGFLISMLFVHLVHIRKISKHMSSFQMFRTCIQYLASRALTEGISLSETAKEKGNINLKEFKDSFDVVMVDPTGTYNLASRVSKDALEEIEHEASLTFEYLTDEVLDSFEPIFTAKNDPQLKYDYHFSFVIKRAEKTSFRNLARKTQQILKKGFADRVHLLRLTNLIKMDKKKARFSFGVIANTTNMFKELISGPSADDIEKAKEFQAFWGEKAEIRRFKDGSIIEAVVWETNDKKQIPEQMVRHLMKRHFQVDERTVKFKGHEIDELFEKEKFVSHKSVQETFETFVKLLRSFSDLPLAVHSVRPSSPALSNTEVFPPSPSLFRPSPSHRNKHGAFVEAVLQFESSGYWPEELNALRAMKSAFFGRLATKVQKKSLGTAIGLNHLDVAVDESLVVRLRIAIPREFALMKRDSKLPVNSVSLPSPEEIQVVYRPNHVGLVHSLSLKFEHFSETVRHIKRWFHGNMFSGCICDEVIELLVGYVFTCPRPFMGPSSSVAGVLRVLELIASFDWAISPLPVFLDASFTGEDYRRFVSDYEKDPYDRSLFIVTPYDFQSVWTLNSPVKSNWQRIVSYAKLSAEGLRKNMEATDFKRESWLSLFRSNLKEFDLILRLNPKLAAQKRGGLGGAGGQAMNRGEIAKTLGLVTFYPFDNFLNVLNMNYSNRALFFYDELRGDTIGLVWKPNAFLLKPFKPTTEHSSLPILLVGEGKKENPKLNSLPNILEILQDMIKFGEGFLVSIGVSDGTMLYSSQN